MHEATVSQPTNGKVYLAVADVKQCKYSLQWALRFIPPQVPLVFLHIYRPATTIPHGKNFTVCLLNLVCQMAQMYADSFMNHVQPCSWMGLSPGWSLTFKIYWIFCTS